MKPDAGAFHQHLTRRDPAVLSVLVVGADILGATTLQSYGLALFVVS